MCKLLLKNQIRDNINDYKDAKAGFLDVPKKQQYKSRQQAIAVAYSQINKSHPRCRQHINKRHVSSKSRKQHSRKSSKSRKSRSRKSRKALKALKSRKRSKPRKQRKSRKSRKALKSRKSRKRSKPRKQRKQRKSRKSRKPRKSLKALKSRKRSKPRKARKSRKSRKSRKRSKPRKQRKSRKASARKRSKPSKRVRKFRMHKTTRLDQILLEYNIIYDDEKLRCVINKLLDTSLQSAPPAHQGAGNRVLGISEDKMSNLEWWEVKNFGQFSFNFGKRGNIGEGKADVSQHFKETLYPIGSGLVSHERVRGSNVINQMARGAYFTFNHTKDSGGSEEHERLLAVINDECGDGTVITNRDMRIIARTVFGLPVFDNEAQTPWKLIDMVSLGLLDPLDGSPFIDQRTPVSYNLALKELLTKPKKIAAKIKSYKFPALANKITSVINDIKKQQGIVDGITDDITGEAAIYPAVSINTQYMMELFANIGAQAAEAAGLPVARTTQLYNERAAAAPSGGGGGGSPADQLSLYDIDISQDTVETMNSILSRYGRSINQSELKPISDDEGERAFSAEVYQMWKALIAGVVHGVVQEYVQQVTAQCQGVDKLTAQGKIDHIIAVASIVWDEGGKTWKHGTVSSPTQICALLKL